MEIVKRYFSDPNMSFLLFGPRGTGKSTWLKAEFPNALYLDLLSPELFRIFSAKPERLQEYIEGNPNKKIIIIDEIQKIPVLLDVVHQLMEKNRDICFIMTGSSSRK